MNAFEVTRSCEVLGDAQKHAFENTRGAKSSAMLFPLPLCPLLVGLHYCDIKNADAVEKAAGCENHDRQSDAVERRC